MPGSCRSAKCAGSDAALRGHCRNRFGRLRLHRRVQFNQLLGTHRFTLPRPNQFRIDPIAPCRRQCKRVAARAQDSPSRRAWLNAAKCSRGRVLARVRTNSPAAKAKNPGCCNRDHGICAGTHAGLGVCSNVGTVRRNRTRTARLAKEHRPWPLPRPQPELNQILAPRPQRAPSPRPDRALPVARKPTPHRRTRSHC